MKSELVRIEANVQAKDNNMYSLLDEIVTLSRGEVPRDKVLELAGDVWICDEIKITPIPA